MTGLPVTLYRRGKHDFSVQTWLSMAVIVV